MYSLVCFFFFKQKTAYEMRISDWSSDVCSSDLSEVIYWRAGISDSRSADRSGVTEGDPRMTDVHTIARSYIDLWNERTPSRRREILNQNWTRDRTSVVEGKSVSVRVDRGGRRIIK